MLKREKYLEKIRPFYDSDLIKILVGIRRCGKSVILKQIMEELKSRNVDESHILFINFELIEFEEYTDYKKLNEYIKKQILDDKMYYLLFDEIQNVVGFEKVINSLRASLNVSIFVTGSNSKLLSSELSTVLSGRYVSFLIHPMSYKETLILLNKKSSRDVFDDFMKWRSLPNRFAFDSDEAIKDYLLSVYDSIILRDVVQRQKIRDVFLFNLIMQYIIDTVGREFSAENVMTYLKNKGKEISTLTLYNYLDALCKALLIKKVYRMDVNGKEIFKTLNKYYVTDLGIAQIKNHNSNIGNAFMLENVVYNELLVKGYDVYVGKTKKGEIDFIAEKTNKKIYIQVAFSVADEEVFKREFGAFSFISDNYPKYVLSLDEREFDYEGIKHVNIIDFLLDDDF